MQLFSDLRPPNRSSKAGGGSLSSSNDAKSSQNPKVIEMLTAKLGQEAEEDVGPLYPGGRPPTWSPPDQTRRAAVGQNEWNNSLFEGSSRYESILRRFGDFLEFLHLRHRDPPRGESVQLLIVANILFCVIIF